MLLTRRSTGLLFSHRIAIPCFRRLANTPFLYLRS
jgi:hypothetical protein